MGKRYFLTNTTVLAGKELKPERAGLLIENGVIASIITDGSCPDGTVTIDGKGAFAVPGMIDCHSHLSLDCSLPDYLNRMNNSEAELAIIAVDTLARDLRHGVTFSRCMGDRFYIDVLCRQLLKEGRLKGPEIQVSGIGMRSSRGHGYVGMPFDGVEELRSAVTANAEHGVDWIKYYSTGTAPKNGELVSFYSREEVACIIREAHSRGLPVTSHCIGGKGLQDAVSEGIDCLEHLYYADEKDVEAVVKNGTGVCLTPSEYFTDKMNAPAANRELFRSFRPVVRKSMERVISSGIPYALGTDGMHGELWREAEYVISFGATQRDALLALTVNGAKLLGISDRKGDISEGKDADLVLVDGDPCADITALGRVRKVLHRQNNDIEIIQ